MDGLLNFLPEFVLFGSVTYFYILVTVFLIVLFASEVNENGWLALISFGVFAILTSWSNLDIIEFFKVNLALVGYYVLIGLGHSMARTYLYGRKRKPERLAVIEEQNEWNEKYRSDEGEMQSTSKIEMFDRTTYDKLKGNVFRWWFLWPVSLLTWVFSDLLRDVWDLIYDYTKKVFQAILDAGMK